MDDVTAIAGIQLDYPPNYIFSYSNLGIALLGHAIQNVAGKPYDQYMQEAVLKPLGMKDS